MLLFNFKSKFLIFLNPFKSQVTCRPISSHGKLNSRDDEGHIIDETLIQELDNGTSAAFTQAGVRKASSRPAAAKGLNVGLGPKGIL